MESEANSVQQQSTVGRWFSALFVMVLTAGCFAAVAWFIREVSRPPVSSVRMATAATPAVPPAQPEVPAAAPPVDAEPPAVQPPDVTQGPGKSEFPATASFAFATAPTEGSAVTHGAAFNASINAVNDSTPAPEISAIRPPKPVREPSVAVAGRVPTRTTAVTTGGRVYRQHGAE